MIEDEDQHEYEMELLRTLTELIFIAEKEAAKAQPHAQSFFEGQVSAFKLMYGIVKETMES